MKNRPPAKTLAKRKRAQRQRMRERGQLDAQTFDATLRDPVLGLYQSGEPSLDIRDLVRAVVTRLANADGTTDRGCRETVRAADEGVGRRADRCCSLTYGLNKDRTLAPLVKYAHRHAVQPAQGPVPEGMDLAPDVRRLSKDSWRTHRRSRE
ncbi:MULTISPECIES: hypothetical protein [Bradyrhizobium]|uniref:hypothetical protein n=1 Tax=Bradyrhizobium TaxID=374 RepID=UPI001EDBD37D|nr:hypothetical protein [Bradyrhizobium zhengyangense]MCG2645194.1 hypothetical protein [Bradyrhizobium zhengyangense]